jgi:hypothetical protein
MQLVPLYVTALLRRGADPRKKTKVLGAGALFVAAVGLYTLNPVDP